jgi:transcriptional regulator with GAF, ATPase, and Fis domain
MFSAESGAFDTLPRSLEQLTRQFVAIVLRLDGQDAGRIVDGMLAQIGGTLAADYVSFDAGSDAGARRPPARVWKRNGVAAAAEAVLTVPVDAAGHRVSVLSIGCAARPESWPPLVEERLTLLASLVALADRSAVRTDAPGQMHSGEARGPSRQPIDEEPGEIDGGDFEDIIGDSPLLRVALRRVLEVAPTDASVVLIGETGTGKELFARAVHNRSRRRGRPFVRVNCAALPPTLIESELFGHERGAFTGAVSTRRGRFELAHNGTLFLDEIGDLPLDVQAKLLRVLQEGEFERVGSSESRKVDVRIVAATHHDLEAAVKDGRFRPDLFYRLSVFPIALPPLRERADDIPRLAWFFINQRQRALNRRFTSIPPPVMAALRQHSWPGNVRELENVIERAMIHSTGSELRLDDGSDLPVLCVTQAGGTLESVERRHIESVLRRCRWRINGTGNAADVLGLHPNTLRFRMKKLGVERPKEPALVVDAGRMSA